MVPHSSTLAWKVPWMQEPGRLQSMGLLRVGHDWAPSLSLFTFMHWRRKWQPTPVFLPGESQGLGSLMGCRLWGQLKCFICNKCIIHEIVLDFGKINHFFLVLYHISSKCIPWNTSLFFFSLIQTGRKKHYLIYLIWGTNVFKIIATYFKIYLLVCNKIVKYIKYIFWIF